MPQCRSAILVCFAKKALSSSAIISRSTVLISPLTTALAISAASDSDTRTSRVSAPESE